jgi:hypothetical protein
MKKFTEEQLTVLRNKLTPYFSWLKNPAAGFHTLDCLLSPEGLSTKRGIEELSNVIYRTTGKSLNTIFL